jgi:hypothetical protein
MMVKLNPIILPYQQMPGTSLKLLSFRGVSVMKREIQSMLVAVTLALASPVLIADENRGNEGASSPQTGSYYGWGPGMMHQPGYGMGPGMMYGPGYGGRC